MHLDQADGQTGEKRVPCLGANTFKVQQYVREQGDNSPEESSKATKSCRSIVKVTFNEYNNKCNIAKFASNSFPKDSEIVCGV